MRIIGLSGKKQSGKNTSANYLHGFILKSKGLVQDFKLHDTTGELLILTENNQGVKDWGIFDISRKDKDFVDYAEYNIWPYVKLYSFADGLKSLCVEFFGLKPEHVYGTDDQKNQIQEHLLWENMPKAINSKIARKILPIDARKSYGWKEGPMTAREFMQFFGTDVMRKMYEPVHVNHTINRIKQEKTELAIIADVRFPNEVESIRQAGGEVIRLTRSPLKDQHDSECALDPERFDHNKFSHTIHNDSDIAELIKELDKFYRGRIMC